MQYNIFVILGSNKSSGLKDTKHKFNMAQYFEDYKNIYWDTNVRNDEVYASTPFYETLHSVEEFIKFSKVKRDDINLCFSRGTFGKHTERFIQDKLVLLNPNDVKTKNIFITKSFGVIDSLKVIHKLDYIDIDLFIAVDGYAPFWIRNKDVTTNYRKKDLVDDVNGKRSRLNILPNLKKYHSIVQRKDKIQGLMFGPPRRDISKLHNYKINTTDIKLYPSYNHYSDRHNRQLAPLHSDMEEICAIVPCCYDDSVNQYLTVNQILIKELFA